MLNNDEFCSEPSVLKADIVITVRLMFKMPILYPK